jgi:polyisoprenoid-binding protein YceI
VDQEESVDVGDMDTMFIVDLDQSMLKREGSKTLVADYYHRGEASLISADIGVNEDGQRTTIQAIVDMQSLTYTEGMSASVLNHLKSDDFFAVETYPTASFVSTAIEVTDA